MSKVYEYAKLIPSVMIAIRPGSWIYPTLPEDKGMAELFQAKQIPVYDIDEVLVLHLMQEEGPINTELCHIGAYLNGPDWINVLVTRNYIELRLKSGSFQIEYDLGSLQRVPKHNEFRPVWRLVKKCFDWLRQNKLFFIDSSNRRGFCPVRWLQDDPSLQAIFVTSVLLQHYLKGGELPPGFVHN